MDDLIKRYVFAVVNEFAKPKQEQIETEVLKLINDKFTETGEDSQKNVEQVLIELGDPKTLANQFHRDGEYLIGAKYYDDYRIMFKWMMGLIWILLIIHPIILILMLNTHFLSAFSGYLTSGFTLSILAFSIITIFFIVIERNDLSIAGKNKPWDLQSLPKIIEINEHAWIESWFDCLFASIILVALSAYPKFLSVYPLDGSKRVQIPFFNLEFLSQQQPLVVIIFMFIILKATIKLIENTFSLKLALIITSLRLLITIFLTVLLANHEIWNIEAFKVLFPKAYNWIYSTMPTTMGVFLSIAALVEIGTAIYRGIKYELKVKK